MMGDVMKEASFSLAEAKFATGHFSHLVLQNVNKAQIKVRSKNDNVAGMPELITDFNNSDHRLVGLYIY